MAKRTSKIKSKLKDENVVLLIISIALISIFMSVTVSYKYRSDYQKLQTEFEEFKNGYTLQAWQQGTPVDVGYYRITVNSVEYDDVGIPEYIPAPDGMQFVTVDLSVTNKASSESIFLPINSTYVRDQDGQKYELTTVPDVVTPIAGRIAAGDTARGQVGYLVPTSSSRLYFYYEPYDGIDKTAVYDITQ